MEKKSLSIGMRLLIILFFSIFCVTFGICMGFFMDSIIGFISGSSEVEKIIIYVLLTIVVGAVHIKLILILLHDYKKNKKEKTSKWYKDKVSITLVLVGIIAAVTLFALGYNNDNVMNYIIGFAMFPSIGILCTLNIVKYALNDMKDWKKIFYQRGNLAKKGNTKDFYKVNSPVPFERKIYFAVVKEQILNIIVVTAIMLIIVYVGISKMENDVLDAPRGIMGAIVYVKARRAAGFLFFATIFIISFTIPIYAYYITNAIYKLRIVCRHEYIAYHVIVNSVDKYTVHINNSGRHYKYQYCSCVGIREKNVHNTKATLIFIPDDVLLIPDVEQDNNS